MPKIQTGKHRRSISAGYLTIQIMWRGEWRWVKGHRFVASLYLGRPLKREEIVHHIDHDKTNNQINNLQICSAQEHAQIHKIWEMIPKRPKRR